MVEAMHARAFVNTTFLHMAQVARNFLHLSDYVIIRVVFADSSDALYETAVVSVVTVHVVVN